MKRTLIATLAATVALPVMATSAAAQQGGYYAGEGTPPSPPYTPERYVTDWDEVERRGQRMGGYRRDDERGQYGARPFADDRWADRPNHDRAFDRPNPPPGYEAERAFREGYRRGYDLGSRDAEERFGRDGRGSYERGYHDERGFDPYSGGRRAQERQRGGMGDMRAMHEMMHRRMHDSGYEDRDFRRDFREDGRRGYYQDPTYEEMPHSGPGERDRGMRPGMERMHGGMRPDMEKMRHAMRMIDIFDVDQDGRVTQQEVDQFRAERLRQFDEDADEALSRAEYEQLWADAMRRRMGERFEDYDVNQDDRITVEEFSERTRDMVRQQDRDRDDALTSRDYGLEERPTEDYTGRPEVEAPLDSGEDHVPREGEPQAAENGAAQDGDDAAAEEGDDAAD